MILVMCVCRINFHNSCTQREPKYQVKYLQRQHGSLSEATHLQENVEVRERERKKGFDIAVEDSGKEFAGLLQ